MAAGSNLIHPFRSSSYPIPSAPPAATHELPCHPSGDSSSPPPLIRQIKGHKERQRRYLQKTRGKYIFRVVQASPRYEGRGMVYGYRGLAFRCCTLRRSKASKASRSMEGTREGIGIIRLLISFITLMYLLVGCASV